MLRFGWFLSHRDQFVTFLCQHLKQTPPPVSSLLEIPLLTTQLLRPGQQSRQGLSVKPESPCGLPTAFSSEWRRWHSRMRLEWDDSGSWVALLRPVTDEPSTPLFSEVLSQMHISALDSIPLKKIHTRTRNHFTDQTKRCGMFCISPNTAIITLYWE